MLLEKRIIIVDGQNITVDEQSAKTLTSFESFLLANEPERVQIAREPLGSDVHPKVDVTSSPPTQNPEE